MGGGSPADKEIIANLQKENEELKAKVAQLEAKQSKLQDTLAELEKKADQGKEAAPIETDAPVEEATEGKTSEEPLASTADKVVAESETAAEVAPVVTAPP